MQSTTCYAKLSQEMLSIFSRDLHLKNITKQGIYRRLNAPRFQVPDDTSRSLYDTRKLLRGFCEGNGDGKHDAMSGE